MRAPSLGPLLLALVLALSPGASTLLRSAPPPARAPIFACESATGAEALLARAGEGLILIEGAEAPRAAEAIGCLAAADGERVIWSGAEASLLAGLASKYAAAGAASAPLPPEDGADDPGARAAAQWAALAAMRRADESGRWIVLLESPDGARAPVGVAGATWRPLGALAPSAGVVSLRAEASSAPGVRVRLFPFSDVPPRGAAMRYDGLIEVGPLT